MLQDGAALAQQLGERPGAFRPEQLMQPGVRSSWTHLIAGMTVAGAGAGLVTPPLASTAVRVVQPEDAGMASGVNSTFRQIGIAVSVAVLGGIFDARISRASQPR